MIDSLHVADELDGGETFIEDFIDIFSRASIPFVFAGLRRFLFAKTPFETMPLEQFAFADAGKLAESLAAWTGVAINDQTRDLIAVQFDGNAIARTDLIRLIYSGRFSGAVMRIKPARLAMTVLGRVMR